MNCCLDTLERFDLAHLELAVKSCRLDKVEQGAVKENSWAVTKAPALDSLEDTHT